VDDKQKQLANFIRPSSYKKRHCDRIRYNGRLRIFYKHFVRTKLAADLNYAELLLVPALNISHIRVMRIHQWCDA